MSFFGDWAYSPQELEFEIPLSDLNHCNLEAPISGDFQKSQTNAKVRESRGSSWKVGPRLLQNPLQVTRSDRSNFIFSLANNHIMDFGEAGLQQTIELVGAERIHGAGSNSNIAREAFLVDLGDLRIGLVACADNFFDGARTDLAGFASLGEGADWVSAQVRQLRSLGVMPIVMFHGGAELLELPSPNLRSKLQGWINDGAEQIIVTHPHIPLLSEDYNGKWIHYGLGNFIVNPMTWEGVHENSLISKTVKLSFKDGRLETQTSFVEICSAGNAGEGLVIRPVSKETENRLLAEASEVLEVMRDEVLYLEVYQLLGAHFIRTFAFRQLFLGSLGLWISRRPVFRRILLSNRTISRRLYEGFGPLLYDLVSPKFTRDLILSGVEALMRGHHYSERSLDISKRLLS